MKFGAVPTAEAVGAILAHSVPVDGRRLRKGITLTQADIADLTAAGVAEVIVARLSQRDVHENAAADLLADALLADARGLTRSAAFTGRVNLLAEGAGVVRLDAAAIAAINAIDPMITIATVPDFQQMRAGGMVATIKIISYAVDRTALERAIAQARGALTLHRPQIGAATLVITDIPGGAGDKGREAIAARLDALEVALTQTVRVPHETAALAGAIAAVQTPLTLILTGSATSDAHDVGPEALRAAGGTVTRFGMPVDPGNLLFLGVRAGRAVIGLPGCARAPALNGADWVLSRLVCGIEVSAEDIAAMGVGGLLKEIPTRPQPRRGPAPKASET
ncbi:molybdopterin-binding protein [Sulfitobacter albidus]|uniref:Molybdopterin-binding protein n=1 Tax=Sulfitobacter albidus TaxID=2829501 RepID=A0A975PNG6_9RHOB|nr:molybdopterin-binding protein [Sulfitobacter albidus]QUJ77451.1 molybdopterin-binding protein [Sulfitobacter albidus]